MPGPSTTSVIAAAILCVAPEANPTPHPSKLVSANPTPHPSKLVSANPTPHPYPVPVIDVLEVDDQLRVQVRQTAAENKSNTKSSVNMEIISIKLDAALPELKVAASTKPTPQANKASPKLMTFATTKLSAGLFAKAEAIADYKVEGGKVLLSIGCDGVVTDGTSNWRLEGPSSFVFPGGTQITLEPGTRGRAKACASVDITGGNQKIHLTGSRTSLKIGEAVELSSTSAKYIEMDHKVVSDNKHPEGAYFVKLAPTSLKLDGSAASWLKMSVVEGKMQPTGVVLDGGNGVHKMGTIKLEMGKVRVTSLIGEDG